ncbi:MAG TPA: prolipoprotein diacylglyceryl transferase family protein [Steroidobacteraceae bacterium]|nr:prolipoprotein diacylglyceryl transferase family protein [Steroidobacteraceae bacterium]
MATSLLTFTQAHPLVHAAIDWSAYAVAGRVYLRARRAQPIARPRLDQLLLLGCTVLGAAVGAVGLHLLASASTLLAAPPSHWIAGKSVLGGFLGGVLGTELGKRIIDWPFSTGDAWVSALVVGLCIGRVGCQLAGTWDMTYGSPTGIALGWDYGDGVPRYPTALLEILGVLAIWAMLRRRAAAAPGWRFNAFLLAYCVLRFFIEFLKPPYGAAAPGSMPIDRILGLTALQWTALAGALWMSARLARTRLRARPHTTACT